MFNLIKKVSLFSMVLCLASCGFFMEPLPDENVSSIRPGAVEPIRLKVKTLDIVSEFTPSFSRPNIEHLLPISIERNARTWARENLEAAEPHSTKVATFIIKDASMTEEFEKSETILRKDRNTYRANLSVALRVADTEKIASAETSTTVWKELSVPSGLTIEQKELYWGKMLKDLFSQFDEAMKQGINKNLTQYVK